MAVREKDLKQKNKKEFDDNNNAQTLCSLIDECSKHNTKSALINFTKKGSTTISYKQLVNQVRKKAAHLYSKGIKKGSNVIFFAANSPEWIISALAAIYSGAIVVPVDPQHSDDVIKHILQDCSANWIFTDEKGSSRLDKILQKSHSQLEHHIIRLDKETNNTHSSSEFKSDSSIQANDIALLFYTSGTTGMPKGVPLNHTNILLQLDSISQLDLLKPKDRLLLPLPLFHVYPLNLGLFTPLMIGLTIILPQSLTGPEILRAINQGKVTVMLSVPRLLRSIYQSIENRFNKNRIVGLGFAALINYCEQMDRLFGLHPGKIIFAPLRKKIGQTLHLLTCGGALLESDLAYKLRALGWEVAIGYGLSETSPLLTVRMPNNRDIESVGMPINGVEVKIEKKKNHDQQNEKNAGEILARGANVFSGYLNRPDLNKEAFTKDGWFRTGDLGVFKNGNLHVLGRASSTIVMEGGEKIQPEDIEDKIAKQPAIAEIGLLQSNHKLVALVVPDVKDNNDNNVKEIISKAIQKATTGMASYLQITNFAITHEPLPRTNIGKIKRYELKERYEKAQTTGKSNTKKSDSTEFDSSDQALMEEPAAAACLKWLKNRFPDQPITLNTNLHLDLNIDSLEWMNLTLELVEQTGVELSDESIAKATTVRDLLNEIISAAENSSEASSPIEDPDHYLNDKQKEYLKPLTKAQANFAHKLFKLNSFVMRLFKVTPIGYEHLKEKQYIFVPNHASYIDAFALAAALTYKRFSKTQWASWVGITFGNPIFSYYARFARAFPIDAKQSLLGSLALGASVLKAGNNLVWFPEGERTLDGKLLPFKAGIGLLIAKTNVTVVPVYLDGTREALPPGAFFPRLHQINVIFGEPVIPKQLAKEGKGKNTAECIANALHDRVQALSKPYQRHNKN